MPAKSQHGKGKHTVRSKRKIVRTVVEDTQSQPQAATVTPVAVKPRLETVSAPAGISRRRVVPVASYPGLVGDIKRTGVLAGIMLLLLLVLYFIFS